MTPERFALLQSIKQWDVLRINGRLRVVREVVWHTRTPRRGLARGAPPMEWFTFVILRCSWTHRPYTIKSSVDLGNPKLKIEIAFRNYRPKQEIELLLQKEIVDRPRSMPQVNCCAVHGLA